MSDATLEYVSDEAGNLESVIVPIEVWNSISSELGSVDILMSYVARKGHDKGKTNKKTVG